MAKIRARACWVLAVLTLICVWSASHHHWTSYSADSNGGCVGLKDGYASEGSRTRQAVQSLLGNLPRDMLATHGKWLLTWQPAIRESFSLLANQSTSANDTRLVAIARRMILPPPMHKIKKFAWPLQEMPQGKEVRNLLKEKRNGFFVECGALNGEQSSNTIYLEQILGWTGLLIEMDPYFFLQLLGHNRKAYSLNACLSPRKTPVVLHFVEEWDQRGRLSDKGAEVPCFPLETLMLALNVTHIDYFSLDVEGFEKAVLEAVPFDKIDITTLSVETAHTPGGQQAVDAYMISQGYMLYSHIRYWDGKGIWVDDSIYHKNTSMP